MNNRVIRCAIYTRKSSEEGLKQDFNSLHAQREACEAYIKSQQHEGWSLVETSYDDGGYSGGNLERPALKELFQDIESGKVDIVVVYKVDRLTRSLMDFSKIVELFDKHSTSFVSITQHFNTTTSMGRLTLNVLLSFAQFEREVTGERIRDKIAASKKKGMWTGGMAPIGYILKDKKLVIDNENAEKVKYIFQKYLELGSVPELKQFLENQNIKSRSGKNFSKGNLYKILSNKVYVGLITHKKDSYQGEHQAIIDSELFEKVQRSLYENKVKRKTSSQSKHASLLAGKIFDDKGNYMSPSHSNTRNRRYRYYVSQACLQSRKNEAGSISKIPAGEIETLVKNEIKNFLSNRKNIQQYIDHFDLHKQKDLLEAMNQFLGESKNSCKQILIRTILSKVILYKDKVEIIFCRNQLVSLLESVAYNNPYPEEIGTDTETPILITKNIRISATAKNGSVLIISDSKNQEANINPQLLKVVAKSYYWNNLLMLGEVKSTTDILKTEKEFGKTYVNYILDLRFIAPDIIEAILNGTQPRDLTIHKLLQLKTLDWQEQRNLLKI